MLVGCEFKSMQNIMKNLIHFLFSNYVFNNWKSIAKSVAQNVAKYKYSDMVITDIYVLACRY